MKRIKIMGGDVYMADEVDARIAELEKALREAKISHHVSENCWYSCPLSSEGCCDARQVECNCGADTHNAKIDAALNRPL